jgi:hypothetical protein
MQIKKIVPLSGEKRRAVALFDGLVARVENFAKDFSFIQEDVRELLGIKDSHLHVNQPSRKAMLKEIFKDTTKSSALYDLDNQFYVESVIGDRGWRQSSLLELYHGAEEENWVEIADLADEAKEDRKRPTAEIVKDTIQSFYREDDDDDEEILPDNFSEEDPKSTKSKASAKSNRDDDEEPGSKSKSERSLKQELKKLKKLSIPQKKITLKTLKQFVRVDEPTQIAINLRYLVNDDQYNDVVNKLEKELKW